jgi:hypothetical protein
MPKLSLKTARRALAHAGRVVVDEVLDRVDDLRWSLRRRRLPRFAEFVIASLLLAALLTLGIFAASASTRGDAKVASGGFASGASSAVLAGEVVTETLMRDGTTVRVIRHRVRPGKVMFETVSGRRLTVEGPSVTLAPRTVQETKNQVSTKTVVKPVTTTQIRTVTTTEIRTVTEEAPPVTVTVTTTVTETLPGP